MTSPDSAARRELGAIIVLVLLGGGGIVFAASRSWLAVTEPRRAPFGPLHVQFAGRTLFPALTGLGLVALIVAVLALITGRWGRRLLGILLVLLGPATGWYALRGSHRPGAGRLRELLGGRLSQQSGELAVRLYPAPAWLALAGSVLLVLAGLGMIVRSGHWQSGLSVKYTAPVEAAKSADPWRTLDRGEDPTISDG
ncbi:MAG: Trp biosynthesis-associated membrane protein [Jatrophihabitans sp.]